MTSNYTPGPWGIREDGLYLRIVHGEHRTTVASGIISERNALLIAEAPAMLAALRKTVALMGDDWSVTCGPHNAHLGDLRTILARIDGESGQ